MTASRTTRRGPRGAETPLAALAARAAGLRAGQGREDGRRLGLVVEGGAMGGIVSAAVLVALAELGLDRAFDVAYGASAGAISLAYFVTGGAIQAADVYTRHAVSRRFVNPFRLHKVLDLDYLVDDLMRRSFPIDVEGLRTCPTELRVSVTDATSGRNQLLSLREPSVDPYAALKASAAVPFLYGRTVRVGTSEFVDGLASNALPVEAALREGCTHVVVILSSRPGDRLGRGGRNGRHQVSLPERILLVRHARGFRRAYLVRRRRAGRSVALALADDRVHVVHPTESCPVPSRTCGDPAEMRAAFEAARARGLAVFSPLVRG